MALGSQSVAYRLPIGCLSVAYQLPMEWLWVALAGFTNPLTGPPFPERELRVLNELHRLRKLPGLNVLHAFA